MADINDPVGFNAYNTSTQASVSMTMPLKPGWAEPVQTHFSQMLGNTPLPRFALQPNPNATLNSMLFPGWSALQQTQRPIMQAMGAVMSPPLPPFFTTANSAGVPNYGYTSPMFSGGRPNPVPGWAVPTHDPISADVGRYNVGSVKTYNQQLQEQRLTKDLEDLTASLRRLDEDVRMPPRPNPGLSMPQRPMPGQSPASFNDIIAGAQENYYENMNVGFSGFGGGGGGRPPRPPGPPPAAPGGGADWGNWGRAGRGIGNMIGIGRFTYGASEVGGALGGAEGAAIAAGIAIAGEAVLKAAKLPLEAGNMAAGIFNQSRPYTNYIAELSNATRLSGQDYGAISRQMIPEWGQVTPSWMSELGITPERALGTISRIGGLRPGMDAQSLVQQTRGLRLSPAYSMLPEGSVEAMVSQGMKYGISSPQTPTTMADWFAGAIETGMRKGADGAEVFKQIQSSTDTMARASIYAPNMAGVANMYQQMFQVDMPGARSGAMQTQLLAGTQQALNEPFANPMRTYIIDSMRRSVDWKSPDSINKLLGPGGYEKAMSSEYGRTAIGALAENMAAPAFLDKTTAGLLQGNSPEVIQRALEMSDVFQGLPINTRNLLRDQLAAGALGVTPEAMGAAAEARGNQTTTGQSAPAGSLPTEAFHSEVEASIDALRGMRSYFNTFGDKIDLINNSFGPLIKNAGDAAEALGRVARSASPATPGGYSGLSDFFTGGATSPMRPGAAGDSWGLPQLWNRIAPSWLGGSSSSGGHSSLSIPSLISPASAAESDTPQMRRYQGAVAGYGDALARNISQGRYPAGTPSLTPGPATADDPRGMIPIIRASAIRYGIDPDVAVQVARHEGLGKYVGDHGTSFGATQLHIGGGLGDQFQKETGLNPADPKNEAAMIDWSMKNLHKTGWTPYHGAARGGISARQGIGVEPTHQPTFTGPVSTGSTGAAKAIDDMMRMKGLSRNDPQVREWIKNNGGNIDPRTAAWCAAFVDASLAHEGVGGRKGAVATNWETFGSAVNPNDVQKGDVMVVTRGLGPGKIGGHLGGATGEVDARGRIQMIQGNKGGKVDTSWENPNDVMIRRADTPTAQSGLNIHPVTVPIHDRLENQTGGQTRAPNDLHGAFDQLAQIVRQVAGHLTDLGQGAKVAHNGVVRTSSSSNSGPNPPTSARPVQYAPPTAI